MGFFDVALEGSDEPEVVIIEDSISVLAEAERARLTTEWLTSLRTGRPRSIAASGSELLDEVREGNC